MGSTPGTPSGLCRLDHGLHLFIYSWNTTFIVLHDLLYSITRSTIGKMVAELGTTKKRLKKTRDISTKVTKIIC